MKSTSSECKRNFVFVNFRKSEWNEQALNVKGILWPFKYGRTIFHHVPKDVSERDSALSWFESLILAHVNAKLFQIRLLKREKKGVLDRDPPRKPDSRTCERKALSERDSCVCILEIIRAEAMHKAWVNQRARTRSKILPPSAQILIVIGKAFAMHVNARSSNHDPNHVLDRDPKHLSERDSSPYEHSHSLLHLC